MDREAILSRIRELDRGIHWDELAGIVEDAHAEVVPPKLVEPEGIAC